MSDQGDSKLIVFGGDNDVVKTSLFKHHITGAPPTVFIPKKFEKITQEEYKFDGNKPVSVVFDDREWIGDEDWPRLRHVYYVKADCVVLCFSIAVVRTVLRILKIIGILSHENIVRKPKLF